MPRVHNTLMIMQLISDKIMIVCILIIEPRESIILNGQCGVPFSIALLIRRWPVAKSLCVSCQSFVI